MDQDIRIRASLLDVFGIPCCEIVVEGIIDFLVREKDFSEDRVRKALERMQAGAAKQKGKTTLEKWFG